MNNRMHVKKGDKVKILSGDAKGKEGKVLSVSPKEGKLIVEGHNLIKKHKKSRKMGDPGGILSAESAFYACKVQVICPHCNKPTRVGYKVFADGTKSRICTNAKCGETL